MFIPDIYNSLTVLILRNVSSWRYHAVPWIYKAAHRILRSNLLTNNRKECQNYKLCIIIRLVLILYIEAMSVKTTIFRQKSQSDKRPGMGVIKPISSVLLFSNFPTPPKYMLTIKYHIHIQQVLPQLSCSDTCQKWMRFKDCHKYFGDIKNFAYGGSDERSLRNLHPRLRTIL